MNTRTDVQLLVVGKEVVGSNWDGWNQLSSRRRGQCGNESPIVARTTMGKKWPIQKREKKREREKGERKKRTNRNEVVRFYWTGSMDRHNEHLTSPERWVVPLGIFKSLDAHLTSVCSIAYQVSIESILSPNLWRKNINDNVRSIVRPISWLDRRSNQDSLTLLLCRPIALTLTRQKSRDWTTPPNPWMVNWRVSRLADGKKK